jgi:hypothetical protein
MMENAKKRLSELILELWNIPSEKRSEEIVEEINKLSPDPSWSNYIFYSEEFVNEDETLNVDGVVNKILSYKPIQL